MIKKINLVEKVYNGDGTISLVAEAAEYFDDMTFSHHNSRSPFTFTDTMTDQEIIDYLIANEYSIYY